MQCPSCQTMLLMSDRHGVEIDYCPECRGVWLDRGELDRIIERVNRDQSNNSEPFYEPNRSRSQVPQDPYHHKRYKKKKRLDFLDDIFDF